MFLLGKDRYLDFKLTTNGAPVTGVTKSQLTVYFVRNGVTCTDALTLTELGAGRYFLKYTPSAEGHDFVEVVYSAQTFTFAEDIVSALSLVGGSSVFSLTSSFITGNVLKVTQVSDPQNWTLYVYDSAGWTSGNTNTYDALASTTLYSDGSWETSPLTVAAGTYHFVIRNLSGSVMVIASNIQVGV